MRSLESGSAPAATPPKRKLLSFFKSTKPAGASSAAPGSTAVSPKATKLSDATPAEKARDTAYTGAAKLYSSDGAMRVAVKHRLAKLPPETRAVAKGKAPATGLAPTDALQAGFAKGAVERQAAERGLTPEQMRHPGIGGYAGAGGAIARLTGKGTGTLVSAARNPGSLPIPTDLAGVQRLTKVEARPVLPTLRQNASLPAAAQINARDQHAAMLQAELDKSSPQLDRALATRDANQLKFGKQIIGGGAGSVGPSIINNGGLWSFIPGQHNPNIKQNYAALAHDVGRGAGASTDPGLIVTSLQHQKAAERLYPTVKDASDQLRPIRAEQAFEKKTNMITDGQDRFYDAQESFHDVDRLVSQSKQEAGRAVPQAPSAAYVSAVPSTVTDAAQRLFSGQVNRHLADGT